MIQGAHGESQKVRRTRRTRETRDFIRPLRAPWALKGFIRPFRVYLFYLSLILLAFLPVLRLPGTPSSNLKLSVRSEE